MLVLCRKPGQKVVLGEGVTLTVVAVQGSRVTLGFEAPAEVSILRAELGDRIDQPTIVWSPGAGPEEEVPADGQPG